MRRGVGGVDPSLSSTGIAILGEGAQMFRRVQSKPSGDELAPRLDRLRRQAVNVIRAIERAAYDDGLALEVIVVEGPAYGVTTQMSHMLAGFWWLLVHGLAQVAPVAVAQPTTLKKFATGTGRAEKDEVLAAAIAAFPGAGIRNNDVADASVLAAMGAVHVGVEFGGGFAPSGRDSVKAVRWPLVKGDRS